jgi:hypothetical protein
MNRAARQAAEVDREGKTMAQRDIIGTHEWHAEQDKLDRIEYERSGELDGCYWCGGRAHKTSDCHSARAGGGPPYDAATATGMYDGW